MPSLNKVILIGHLGHAPEIREVKNGSKVGTFSIATTEVWYSGETKNEKTEWHKINAWGKLADKCSKLDKGMLVYIEGSIRTSTYTSKDGTEKIDHSITAYQILRLERSEKKEPTAPPADLPPMADDDIPF